MYYIKRALRGRMTNKRLTLASATCRRRCNITLLISLFVTRGWTVVNEELTLDLLKRFLQCDYFVYFPGVKHNVNNHI